MKKQRKEYNEPNWHWPVILAGCFLLLKQLGKVHDLAASCSLLPDKEYQETCKFSVEHFLKQNHGAALMCIYEEQVFRFSMQPDGIQIAEQVLPREFRSAENELYVQFADGRIDSYKVANVYHVVEPSPSGTMMN